MAITLSDVKEYLRIDSSAEDAILMDLIEASEAYLEGAVDDYADNCTNDTKFAIKASMVQKVVIGQLYENRNSTGEQYNRVIESMVRQLQNYAGGE